MERNEAKPLIYQYTDYREFLKTLIECERVRSGFSYAKFALRAGFKSRSYLRTVITGKRNLSPDAIAKVIVGFGLSHSEGEAFRSLVHFNQSSDFQTRKLHWESFLKCRPKNQKPERVRDEYLYLARMAYPILLIILRQPHVEKSLASLSKMTGLTENEVKDGVETLIKLGAVSKLPDGSLIVTVEKIVTSNDIPNVAIQTFHNNMLDKAKSAISLSPKDREFQSMMLPLTEDEFLYLRQRARALMEEAQDKFGGTRPKSKKVYALNMNIIPITPDFIRLDEKIGKAANSTSPVARQKSAKEVIDPVKEENVL